MLCGRPRLRLDLLNEAVVVAQLVLAVDALQLRFAAAGEDVDERVVVGAQPPARLVDLTGVVVRNIVKRLY